MHSYDFYHWFLSRKVLIQWNDPCGLPLYIFANEILQYHARFAANNLGPKLILDNKFYDEDSFVLMLKSLRRTTSSPWQVKSVIIRIDEDYCTAEHIENISQLVFCLRSVGHLEIELYNTMSGSDLTNAQS